jgi:chromatin assembly factor 1 subunit A
MRLNSFFAKPSANAASLGQSTTTASPSKPLASNEIIQETPRDQKSDYERAFPAFFLQSHTTLAPPHRFERDSGSLEHVRQTVDACLNADAPTQSQPFRPSEVFNMIPFHRKRGRVTSSVKEILVQLQKTGEDSTDVPQNQSSGHATRPEDLLRKITMKSLKFGEDIRPPYQGTYTRPVPASSAKRLSRNPYYRGLPDTDYDYDSEAEWEEPEEGEELDSEEEEEGSDDGEDDLDGFLDDEDDSPADGKRRLIVGDLEPVCSGIQWAANGINPELQVYQIQTISDAVKFPIDPFSTAYWEKPKPAPPAKATAASGASGASGRATLDAFRVPAVPGGPVSTALPPGSKAKRPFPPEQLGEFKEAVEGNDLSKIGLVEILKKRLVLQLSLPCIMLT